MLRRSPRQLRSRYQIVTPTIAPTSRFSLERRLLCNQDAMARLPPLPPICPLCQVPGTRFKIYLAYKDDSAGWWCILCHGCKRVDVPLQVGPPANLAALIDARIQLEAAEEEEKRKDKEDKDAVAAVEKFLEQERKAAKATERAAKEAEKEAAKIAKARKRNAAHLAHLEKVQQDVQRREEKAGSGRKKVSNKQHPIFGKREIQLTLWHKVQVTALAPVAEHLQAGRFVEYWDLDDASWTPSEAPAQVREGAPSLLVRFTDVKHCPGFGLHVHLLQDGSASTATARKREIADAKRMLKAAERRDELTDQAWAVVWAHDNKMPLVGRLELDAKRSLVLTSTLVLERTFKALNVDTVQVWNLDKTDWEEYKVDEPIPVRGCDTLLARVPDVEKLTYLGVEVLAHHIRRKEHVGLKERTNGAGPAAPAEVASTAGNSTGLRATAGINWVY
ncbi:hypothetical protein LXA43DRAFT_1063880 [Ganoderma leucocontextum]|nr:hypothetical protein LXA43DRAFT_1063880 [Ganoderma leucocontextum]